MHRDQMPLPIPRLYLSLRQSLERPRLTPEQLKKAEAHYRKVYARCPHEPRCAGFKGCVRLIADEMRQNGHL